MTLKCIAGRAGLATVGTVELVVSQGAGPENVARAVLATLPHSFVAFLL